MDYNHPQMRLSILKAIDYFDHIHSGNRFKHKCKNLYCANYLGLAVTYEGFNVKYLDEIWSKLNIDDKVWKGHMGPFVLAVYKNYERLEKHPNDSAWVYMKWLLKILQSDPRTQFDPKMD